MLRGGDSKTSFCSRCDSSFTEFYNAFSGQWSNDHDCIEYLRGLLYELQSRINALDNKYIV